MKQREIRIKKLSDRAVMPTKATEGSAGYDLSAAIKEPMTIQPGEIVRIPTGLAIELPDSDLVAMIYARSGLSVKHGITLPNGVGVIDSDYRGEIKIGAYNFTNEPCIVENGERLAQLVVTQTAALPVLEAEELGETERGEGGFGSTGTAPVKEETT